MRRRHQRHSTVDDFRQNLDPLQVTLAHRNQSHRQSPTSSNAGSVTFQLCRNRTLQLCGGEANPSASCLFCRIGDHLSSCKCAINTSVGVLYPRHLRG
ncbi:hypothetical protein ELH99_37485 [Rhizobium leguminosarum]|nr:hypothetical protein ELH99_37485 [Rhizobium leguminosarum]TAY24774.1 hypothetical protein ELH89_36955 [Rhizobium leguminosarum]